MIEEIVKSRIVQDRRPDPAEAPRLVPRGLSRDEQAEFDRLSGRKPQLEAELVLLQARRDQWTAHLDRRGEVYDARVQALVEGREYVAPEPPAGDPGHIKEQIKLHRDALERIKIRLTQLAEWSRVFVMPHQQQKGK